MRIVDALNVLIRVFLMRGVTFADALFLSPQSDTFSQYNFSTNLLLNSTCHYFSKLTSYEKMNSIPT